MHCFDSIDHRSYNPSIYSCKHTTISIKFHSVRHFRRNREFRNVAVSIKPDGSKRCIDIDRLLSETGIDLCEMIVGYILDR